MSKPPSIEADALIDAWCDAGLVAPQTAPAIAAAIREAAADAEPPLYLKILSAVGTALATSFVLAFLVAARVISMESGAGFAAWGVVFLAAGLALAMALRGAAPGLGRDFLAQSTFAAIAVGKVLFVGGAIVLFGERTAWVPTLALLVVTVLTYPVSGASLDRFVSPYAVFVSALVELLGRGDLGLSPSLALAVFHAVATAIAGVLLLSPRAPAALKPLGSAALAAMGTVVCLLAAGHDLGLRTTHGPIDPRPIEAMLVLSLIGAVVRVAGGVRALARPPVAAAIVGVIALGFAGAPGVGFALLVLLVGHDRHDTPMRVAGILALPAFLVVWYWGRDLTFLAKSAALVGSGGGLLAARALMALRGWDREETP